MYEFLKILSELCSFLKKDCPCQIVFILVNSAEPDEMMHYIIYVVFYQVLHCLPEYLFMKRVSGKTADMISMDCSLIVKLLVKGFPEYKGL